MATSPHATRLLTAEERNKALHQKGRTAVFPAHLAGCSMNQKLCFSPAEAAGQLGICKNHIYRYLDSGELRSFKLGQRRLINREALDEFRMNLEKLHTTKMVG